MSLSIAGMEFSTMTTSFSCPHRGIGFVHSSNFQFIGKKNRAPAISLSKFREPLQLSHARKARSSQYRASTVHMVSNGRMRNSEQRATDGGDVLPKGAFTLRYRVKFGQDLSMQDCKAVLSEYGRKTCAEPGVLRCDILYDVNSSGRPKNDFYDIWTSFVDSRGYTEHERTAHASKLRLCLENPSGGDNSVFLTRLAHQVCVLKPVRPCIDDWRSSFDFAEEWKSEQKPLVGRIADAHQKEGASKSVRDSLEMIIASVGLENVIVLLASATAKSHEDMRSLRNACNDYMTEIEKSFGVVRTGLLIERNDPFSIVLMSVHDGTADEGACFDMDFAADYITDGGWSVKRCFAVFPDKVGWEKPLPEEELNQLTGKSGGTAPYILNKDASQLSRQEPIRAEEPKLQLLQGPGAFDELKGCIRIKTHRQHGKVKALLIGGWNSSRLHPLLVQLEYNSREDPGEINFEFSESVLSTQITTKRIRRIVNHAKEFQADIILAYGGGTVMDMAKMVGKLGRVSIDELESHLSEIDDLESCKSGSIDLTVAAEPIPIILLPTTIGSGAEMTELCIVAAQHKNRGIRRLSVNFKDSPNTPRYASERTVLMDSRLVSPKRISGHNAAQGGLQLVCLGIDVLLSMCDYPESQSVELAAQGIAKSFNHVIPALREPFHASGASRDPLVEAQAVIGLASDTFLRIGFCVRVALAVIDTLVDGRSPRVFRTVLIRITAAVLEEVCQDQFAEKALIVVAKAIGIADRTQMSKKILEMAEDCDVRLLNEVGMVQRRVPDVAFRVVAELGELETCGALEQRFLGHEQMTKMLESAISQRFEL